MHYAFNIQEFFLVFLSRVMYEKGIIVHSDTINFPLNM